MGVRPGDERKIAVVTGAASGIGAETATLLKGEGYVVVAMDKDDVTGVDQYVPVDLSQVDSIADAVAALPTQLDALVNVAGVPGSLAPDLVLAVNFFGLRELTERVFPLMREGGAIVNVSSLGDFFWRAHLEHLQGILETESFVDGLEEYHNLDFDHDAYSFSKELVSVYTLSMAKQAAAKGVRVNAVRPGLTQTPRYDDFTRGMAPGRLEQIESLVGRHAQPADIAAVIRFLVSDQAGWVNGELIAVDGGLSAMMEMGDGRWSE